MAGKNTAAFGIYTNRTQVENAVDTLKAEGYRNTDISVLFPENVVARISLTKKTRRPRKALRLEQVAERYWEGPWAGWRALAPSPYLALVLSSRLAR